LSFLGEPRVGPAFLSSSSEVHALSHIVQIQTEIRDPIALDAATYRLGLPDPVFGPAKLFSTTVTGWQVRLPEWRYPVVVDVNTGKLDFDNYGGRWGEQAHLDRLVQRYAVEKSKIEARKKGYTTTEQELNDGSIKLTVQIGGGL